MFQKPTDTCEMFLIAPNTELSNANPGLKVNWSKNVSCKKVLPCLVLVKFEIIQAQNWRTNIINRKLHWKDTNSCLSRVRLIGLWTTRVVYTQEKQATENPHFECSCMNWNSLLLFRWRLKKGAALSMRQLFHEKVTKKRENRHTSGNW